MQEIFIKPKIEDHGKQVKCEALIQDNENVTLFNTITTSTDFFLDIKFPPQSSLNQSLNGDKGDNLTITFSFKANPEPQEIKWVVTVPEIVDSANYSKLRKNDIEHNNNTVVELTPGHVDDKYEISNLTSNADLEYEVTMTIFNLEQQVLIIL